MLLTPSSIHQVWADDENLGYLSTDPDSLMLRVYIYNTQFQLRDAGFFMPLRPFFDDAKSYFGLSLDDRVTYTAPTIPWDRWMKLTRWLHNDGLTWMQEVRRNQKGVGSRYVFPHHIVDFSPTVVAREVAAHDPNFEGSEAPLLKSFNSDVNGFTTVCGAPAAVDVAGCELFREPIRCSLPYREKALPELPGYSPDSDLHLIGDKLISVEVRGRVVYPAEDLGLTDCSTGRHPR